MKFLSRIGIMRLGGDGGMLLETLGWGGYSGVNGRRRVGGC